MLSYLTSSSSDSGLAICSTSLDETNKSLYPNEDEHQGYFNSYQKPLIYTHPSTSTYGFGLNIYDEISPLAFDTTRSSYTYVHTTKRADPNIDVKLDNIDLWRRFAELNLEMIITKTGRRMFPTFKISITGLEPTSKYFVYMDVVPVDNHRYKYHNSQWIVTGAAEPHMPGRFYPHPDSNSTGTQLMKQPLLFNKLKLTNNTADPNGHIVLNSMHKYIPRVHIIQTTKSSYDNVNIFVFPETQFIAVTAYQNENVTRLKIDHNPFAKGFRENNGHTNRKETKSFKRCHDDDDDNNDNDNDNYDNRSIYPTPESSKRRKISSDDDDQTPPSRILPTNHTVDVPDSTTSFTDFYENQLQSSYHFYDPNLYNSPYSRFNPSYPFPYTPMTPISSTPFGRYSFSSPYYQ